MRAREEPLNFTDVYTTLDANDCTILYWLKRLVRFGILKGVRSEANQHSTYYSIGDKESTESIIERYHWNVGFKLGRLIPYRKTKVEKIRKDNRFIKMCEEYYLTLDEGIEAVKKCPKIEVTIVGYPFNGTYLHRTEQGYDEPEKAPKPEPKLTSSKLLEEAKSAIS